jgi:flagellin-like hook-associated protein FlgL
MYSGNDSTVMPFANNVQVSGGTASDIVFDLSGAATDVTIEISDSTGTVVRTLTTTSGVEGTNTITWDGYDDSGNALADGNYSFTVTASTSAGDTVASYPSYRGGEGGKEIITGESSTVVLNNNGGDIFSNALNVLSQAITTLNNTDTSSTVISDLIASLKDAISQIQTEEVALSNKNSLLGNSTSRLDELTTYVNSRISDTETGDTTKSATELKAQETAYETTMSATADVLKMSTLKDYLS